MRRRKKGKEKSLGPELAGVLEILSIYIHTNIQTQEFSRPER
jgi:hypothetical protein